MKIEKSAVRRQQNVIRAVQLLRESRDLLSKSGANRTVKRVRHALRSADGALRNADRFAFKEIDNYIARKGEAAFDAV